jgi:hypothetical protein
LNIKSFSDAMEISNLFNCALKSKVTTCVFMLETSSLLDFRNAQ